MRIFPHTKPGVGRVNINAQSVLSKRLSGVEALELGGLASLDLCTRTKLPIGLLLGYTHTSYPESSGDLVEKVGNTTFRIAYTGRREFSLGLEFGYCVRLRLGSARSPLSRKRSSQREGTAVLDKISSSHFMPSFYCSSILRYEIPFVADREKRLRFS